MSEQKKRTLADYCKGRSNVPSKEVWRIVGVDAEAHPLPDSNQLCLLVVKNPHQLRYYEVARFDLNGWDVDDCDGDADSLPAPLECGFLRDAESNEIPMSLVEAWLPLPEPVLDGWEMYNEETTEAALGRAQRAVNVLLEYAPEEIRQLTTVRMHTDLDGVVQESIERRAAADSVIEEPSSEDTFQ